jgi:hypothetical protein
VFIALIEREETGFGTSASDEELNERLANGWDEILSALYGTVTNATFPLLSVKLTVPVAFASPRIVDDSLIVNVNAGVELPAVEDDKAPLSFR